LLDLISTTNGVLIDLIKDQTTSKEEAKVIEAKALTVGAIRT